MTAVYKNFDDGFEDNIEKIRWSQRCFGSYVVDAFHSIGYNRSCKGEKRNGKYVHSSVQ